MTTKALQDIINKGRIHKPEVDRIVTQILQKPSLVKPLLALTYQHDAEDNFMASWVFDHVMRKDIQLLLPVVDTFLSGMAKLQSESNIRPAAHICQLLTEGYFKQKDPVLLKHLNTFHLEQMATVCFDWLIQEHKVATHVFAMTSLFYLGHQFEWIRPELKSILEKSVPQGSAGYQNRGIKLLNKLQKLGY